MAQRRLRRLICRLRGHTWQVAEVPVYHPDGRVSHVGQRRFCTRCPARTESTW